MAPRLAMDNRTVGVFRKLIQHPGEQPPASSQLRRLRHLGIWAPTAFGALLLALTLALYPVLPLWFLVLLILGVSLAGAAGFSGFVFAQIRWREEEILRRTEELEVLSRALGAAVAHNARILAAAGEGIYGLDAQGLTTFVNPAAARMIGWEAKDLIGKPMHEILHHTKPCGTPYHADECPIHAAVRDGTLHHVETEVFWRKDGTSFPVEYTSTPIREDGDLLGAVVTFKEITERKRAEEDLRRARDEMERRVRERTEELAKTVSILREQIKERQRVEERLRRSEEQLHALSAHLLSVQEEERSRIAREIHDELGQALTAMKIDLAWVGQHLSDQPASLRAKLQRMARLVDETVEAVRQLATELRPGVLDDLGLVAALEWQVREFQERTGVACTFAWSPADLALDPARATAVFRICQEALTNVVRHAEATEVEIALRMEARTLILEVRDNGKGIPAAAVTDPHSIGLMGMRERVLPWRGDVAFQGRPGHGTLVRVALPLEHSPAGSPGGRP
ncbi:MAG: PAS domain-containing sensor histidine kinase [candidate division NC10 bacterium]|nr:PAS domain-containing sensor histidine kinase [candidate division NC10 bacterium]